MKLFGLSNYKYNYPFVRIRLDKFSQSQLFILLIPWTTLTHFRDHFLVFIKHLLTNLRQLCQNSPSLKEKNFIYQIYDKNQEEIGKSYPQEALDRREALA